MTVTRSTTPRIVDLASVSGLNRACTCQTFKMFRSLSVKSNLWAPIKRLKRDEGCFVVALELEPSGPSVVI